MGFQASVHEVNDLIQYTRLHCEELSHNVTEHSMSNSQLGLNNTSSYRTSKIHIDLRLYAGRGRSINNKGRLNYFVMTEHQKLCPRCLYCVT
jgi:hypothetical protein